MARPPVILLSAGLLIAAVPSEAARKRVQVPDQYDGAWSIVATTTAGPCAASTRYQVRIKNSDASVPGDDIDVDGGVSTGGAVQATIVQGSNRVPITGRLDVKGSGSGTWRTEGGLIECSGSWQATRSD